VRFPEPFFDLSRQWLGELLLINPSIMRFPEPFCDLSRQPFREPLVTNPLSIGVPQIYAMRGSKEVQGTSVDQSFNIEVP